MKPSLIRLRQVKPSKVRRKSIDEMVPSMLEDRKEKYAARDLWLQHMKFVEPRNTIG